MSKSRTASVIMLGLFLMGIILSGCSSSSLPQEAETALKVKLQENFMIVASQKGHSYWEGWVLSSGEEVWCVIVQYAQPNKQVGSFTDYSRPLQWILFRSEQVDGSFKWLTMSPAAPFSRYGCSIS